jgi:hypothetical protein
MLQTLSNLSNLVVFILALMALGVLFVAGYALFLCVAGSFLDRREKRREKKPPVMH